VLATSTKSKNNLNTIRKATLTFTNIPLKAIGYYAHHRTYRNRVESKQHHVYLLRSHYVALNMMMSVNSLLKEYRVLILTFILDGLIKHFVPKE